MYKSSQTLHNSGEYHNACYLAGYVVECYAKIIVGLSYGFTHDEIAKEFVHDLKKLNKELQYILTCSPFSTFIVDLKIDFADIVSGNSKWNPIKRYSNLSWSVNDSTNFQNQLPKAVQILTQMSLDTSSNLI
jgi:hypothetical protein